uniref:(northern house mosquito) hypothetical protein n=1 Tax=Culex pipiens TaxID=7175 RepID=A0A8D8DLL4_CULPI
MKKAKISFKNNLNHSKPKFIAMNQASVAASSSSECPRRCAAGSSSGKHIFTKKNRQQQQRKKSWWHLKNRTRSSSSSLSSNLYSKLNIDVTNTILLGNLTKGEEEE